jgi:SpoVK/Ycf46/Vps4 family AAA+-type ATPase/intein/homing endonuclease
MAEEESSAKLKVGELTERGDFGRGIIRISAKDMKNIGISEGDVVEVEGKRKTAAIAVRAYPVDVGLDIVRMDGLERRNCGAGIGELVKIKRADIKEAKAITIAPARKGIIIHMGGNLLKQNLLMRPLMTGDIIIPNPIVQDRRSQTTLFEQFFGVDFGDFLFTPFGEEKFVVINTDPKGIVRVTRATDVELLPQATRPLEEEKIPEVTYEDLGGLHEEIKKVREMIELPLKHPELFERLGIEPPRGILLHGPPGTGKTLLAKAVANESGAKFFVINGPEIMCVDGETKIFTNPKGYVRAKDIFERDGNAEEVRKIEVKTFREPMSTFAIDKNGRITKAHITHTTKLVAPSYRVVLSDGNKITVSHNQPFLAYENGELVWKRVTELKEGDYAARISKVDIKGESIEINPEKVENVVRRNGRYSLKSRNLSRSNFIKLPKKSSSELLEFLGLVVSEGSIDKRGDGITFANLDKCLREKFKMLCRRLFDINHFHEDKEKVSVYSKTLVGYLKLLGFESSNKVIIPGYFFRLPEDEIAAFVRGYFEGDGTIGVMKIGGMKYPTPVLYSVNRGFLQELQALLQVRLGIATKLKEHGTPKGLMHKLVIRGHEGRVKFSKIGSGSRKLNKLQEIRKVKRIKEHENIPRPVALINAVKTLPYKKYRNHDYYIYGNRPVTRHAMKRLFEIAEKNRIVNDTVKKEVDLLSRTDIAWERIKKIEFAGEQELYDFTVDKDNFIGGPYFFLHNSKFYGESEENLRKVFEQAEKSAPSIIFIDELDAIAPKREEVKGEVEKRVVSQLLTLLDGLKSRGKIIVIGATNIPNSIDPALRRPGRFDREIELGVPNKDGRKEILQIHTRGMPLYTVEMAIQNIQLSTEERNFLSQVNSKIPEKKEEPTEDDIIEAIRKIDKNDIKVSIDLEKTKNEIKKIRKNPKVVYLERISDITYGYVGADIAALCKEGAMHALRRVLPDVSAMKGDKPINQDILKKLIVTKEDFDHALKMVEPSAMREVLIEIPKITWADIGGLEDVKKLLKEIIEWPLKYPDSFKQLGIKPPTGVLLYGPPGTGKTLLAKAIANESGANFISVKGPELLSMWVGESERHVRDVFRRAKQVAPCIIFFDEVDALVPRRGMSADSHVSERVVSQLLAEISGLEELHGIVVIAATNRPDIVDPALLRPGRLERQILVPTPDETTRLEILKVHTKDMPLTKDVDIKAISKETSGYSGADLESLCRESAFFAMRRNINAKEVTKEDFAQALNSVKSSLTEEMNQFYESVLKKRKSQIMEEEVSYMG